MSAMPEELITEREAARYLGLEPDGLKELVADGLLHCVDASSEAGQLRLYHISEVLKLKERIQIIKNNVETRQNEWPELIEVD